MDAGFQSLGPFNRAFKTITGVTPTEYRRLKAPAI
jgi:AraC-like DNA-binding protein